MKSLTKFAGVLSDLARNIDLARDSSSRGRLSDESKCQVTASIAAVASAAPRFALELGLDVPSGALPERVNITLAIITVVRTGAG